MPIVPIAYSRKTPTTATANDIAVEIEVAGETPMGAVGVVVTGCATGDVTGGATTSEPVPSTPVDFGFTDMTSMVFSVPGGLSTSFTSVLFDALLTNF